MRIFGIRLSLIAIVFLGMTSAGKASIYHMLANCASRVQQDWRECEQLDGRAQRNSCFRDVVNRQILCENRAYELEIARLERAIDSYHNSGCD